MHKAWALTGWIVASLVLLLAGCAGTQQQHGHHHHGGSFTQHYSDTLFQVTDDGVYSVELLPGDHGTLVTGKNKFQVVVHNQQDQDVSGAAVTAKAFKPSDPTATFRSVPGVDREGGLYTFSGLDLNSPGHWNLTVEVRKGGSSDATTFEFPNVAAPMAGHGSMEKSGMEGMTHGHGAGMMHHHAKTRERPANMDTSTTVMSEKGLFKVSYEPMVSDIPVGRIHSWKIKVFDAKGNPMDAKVLVTGEMPEHGHGLPTEPDITQRLDKGVYRLDGLKFSMPGWWVMHVQVLTMDQKDKAMFNLVLQ